MEKKKVADKSLLYEFALDTTAHGAAKIAKAETRAKRLFWISVVIFASLASIIMIGLRFQAYLEFNTVVEINKEFGTEIDFPAVTVCNFNKLRSSYSQGENAKAMSFLNDMLSDSLQQTDSTCSECNDNQFRCYSDMETCCIPRDWKCDQYVDCVDGSDETDCVSIYLYDFFTDPPVIDANSSITICSGVTPTNSSTAGWLATEGFGERNYENNLNCEIMLPVSGQKYLVAHIWTAVSVLPAVNEVSYQSISCTCLNGSHIYDIKSFPIIILNSNIYKETRSFDKRGFLGISKFIKHHLFSEQAHIPSEKFRQIENGNHGCEYDKLTVGLAVLCGVNEKSIALDIQNITELEIAFTTDGGVSNLGFAIDWHFSDTDEGLRVYAATTPVVANTHSTTGIYTVCNSGSVEQIVVDSYSVAVMSHPGYVNGGLYDPNSNCSIQISTGYTAVTLHFGEIGINGVYPNCTTDYVSFRIDGTTIKYCGNDTALVSDVSIPPYTTFHVSFLSGDSDGRQGFALVLRVSNSGQTSTTGIPTTDGTINDGTTPTGQTAEEYRTVSGGDVSTFPSEPTESEMDEESSTGHTTEARTFASWGRRKRSANVIDVFKIIRKRSTNTSDNATTTQAKTSAELSVNMNSMKYSSIINAGGWKLEDKPLNYTNETFTLLQCSFRGTKCGSTWFQHVYTQFGNCYTFNGNGLLTDELTNPLSTPLKQIQPGPSHGLYLLIDAERDQYAETATSGNTQVGLKFQVHDIQETPDVENQGIAVSTGQHFYAGFRMQNIHNQEAPWGHCNRSLKLEYSDRYSFHQCAVECKLKHVFNMCNCKPFYYPGPARECSATELKICAVPEIAKLDRGDFAKKCYCPISCDHFEFEMKSSQVEFAGTSLVIEEMNSEFYGLSRKAHPRNNSNFYKDNVVSLNIYFDELSKTTAKQMKALDESSLLSDLGGQFGLFIGVSVITVCELFETIVMAIARGVEKRKLRRVAEKWVTHIEALKVQKSVDQEKQMNMDYGYE